MTQARDKAGTAGAVDGSTRGTTGCTWPLTLESSPQEPYHLWLQIGW